MIIPMNFQLNVFMRTGLFSCLFQYDDFSPESMPSTERVILRPVDGERNLKCGKPGFRCVAHKTRKIAVIIEICDLIAIG